jgi:hypothetical protein
MDQVIVNVPISQLPKETRSVIANKLSQSEFDSMRKAAMKFEEYLRSVNYNSNIPTESLFPELKRIFKKCKVGRTFEISEFKQIPNEATVYRIKFDTSGRFAWLLIPLPGVEHYPTIVPPGVVDFAHRD